MDDAQIVAAVKFTRGILVFQVFDTSVWMLVGCAVIGIFVGRKAIPKPVLLLNFLLLFGTGLYVILWFHALDMHDYYFINPIVTLLVLVVTFLWWLKERYPKLFDSTWLRVGFLVLLGYNVAYVANNMHMRSNPYKQLKSAEVLPLYHEKELLYWNSIANNELRDLQTIIPFCAVSEFNRTTVLFVWMMRP